MKEILIKYKEYFNIYDLIFWIWTIKNILNCTIFCITPNNSIYLNNNISKFFEDGKAFSYYIPNEKGQPCRWIMRLPESDIKYIREHSQVGDNFELWYTSEKLDNHDEYNQVVKMNINDKTIIEYSWFRLHYMNLICIVIGLTIVVILPTIAIVKGKNIHKISSLKELFE